MGALLTGMLSVATVVLSQLFTLLFIGIVGRLLQHKGRGCLTNDRTEEEGVIRAGYLLSPRS